MNYKQTLDYMYRQLPMFHKIGADAYKANLDNTIALCNILGHPYRNFKSIHVAGTNGKGSVSHMLASVLQENGLKVGLFTSPHLKDFRERIKINGKMISKSLVSGFLTKYQKDFKKIKPSFFEMTVGLAFQYFDQENVDIAVIETGLGGRLDSTNVITPLVSIITNIGLDHIAILGNTIEKIAYEKACIIKKNIPVVIGESHSSSKPVFTKMAKDLKAPIYFADKEFEIRNIPNEDHKLIVDVFNNMKLSYNHLECGLTGQYQCKNLKSVLKAIDILKRLNITISEESIYKGIKNVINNTGLYGRWQILSKNPLTICDTGHNEDGIQEVIQQIRITQHNQLHFVIGMVNDKSIDSVLKLLPDDAVYYFCKADIPRGLDEKELAKMAYKNGLNGNTYPSVKTAFLEAKSNAKTGDLVFVGGSTFVVAEVI